ncbi:hypothetical protein CC86DRAFT_387694 [Ophiobolus disseminans]|uniref:Uncharacterized protein n=1 Tax=Ophiobolus disseminans TaxID=1469910 RepID=A0A6A6ZG65_9PLEO|nr:hypothetical protein CC86DRAFT_387694 [Ophiobolus disseminans]
MNYELMRTAPFFQMALFRSTNPPDTSLTGVAYSEAAAARESHVVIRAVGSRGLTAIFLLEAVFCLSVLVNFRYQYKDSGLKQDPGGVSSIASLLIGSNIPTDPNIDLRNIQFKLKNGTLNTLHSVQQGATPQGQRSDPIDPRWMFLATTVFGVFLATFVGVGAATNLVYSLRRVP